MGRISPPYSNPAVAARGSANGIGWSPTIVVSRWSYHATSGYWPVSLFAELKQIISGNGLHRHKLKLVSKLVEPWVQVLPADIPPKVPQCRSRINFPTCRTGIFVVSRETERYLTCLSPNCGEPPSKSATVSTT